nr:TPA_asm: acintoc2 [Parasteatoda house spider adintovirus]
MEYAKKMILVPEHLVSRHVLPDEKLSELDREMKQILLSQMDEDEKIKMYNQVLLKRIKLDSLNSPISNKEIQSDEVPDEKPEIKEEENYIESLMLSSMPKQFTSNTKNVLEFLKKNNDVVSWTPRGELVHKGEVVKNSNIVDLLNNMMRKKKNNTFITGQEEFREIIKDINLPRTFIKNESYVLQKGSSLAPKLKKIQKKKPYQWLQM